MSDYISKSAVIEVLKDEFCADCTECGGHCRHDDLFEIIDKQPTLDETEIIRKAFERVVEKLEEKMPISWKFDYIGGKKDGIVESIKIVKEECGINE